MKGNSDGKTERKFDKHYLFVYRTWHDWKDFVRGRGGCCSSCLSCCCLCFMQCDCTERCAQSCARDSTPYVHLSTCFLLNQNSDKHLTFLRVLCTFVLYHTRYYDVLRSGSASETPQIMFRTYGTGQLAFLWDWVRCLSRGYRVCSNFMILRGN